MRQNTRYFFSLAALALVGLWLCTSCSGSAQQPARPQPPVNPNPGAAAVVDMAPAEMVARLVPHATSFSPANLVKQGADYEDGLPLNRMTRDAEAATFAPNYSGPASGLNGLAFAVWRFNVEDFSGAAKLRLNWSAPPASESDVLAGLGNFDAGRWDWFAWVPGNATDFGSMAPYVDGGGNVLVCVILAGTDAATIASLRIGDLVLSGQLVPQPEVGFIAEAFGFDASSLLPNGGTIINYEWDFAGDGVFEFDSDLDPSANNTYSAAAEHTVAVRIRTDEGLTAVASTTIRVLNNVWQITQLADGPQPDDAPFDPQIALINGKPAVAYGMYMVFDPSSGESETQRVYYRQATDSQANAWGAPIEALAYDWFMYRLADLQAVNGAPAICYQGYDGELGYTRAADAGGTNWPDPVNAASDMDTSSVGASIAVLGGVPHIAYVAYDPDNMHTMARHAYALDATGAAWAVSPNFSGGGYQDFEISLADIGGPVVAYYSTDIGSGGLEVMRASSADGAGAWAQQVFWETIPRHISLASVGGRLAVYYSNNSEAPRVLLADDLTGTPGTWNSHMIDDFDNYPADYGSLAGPCLSYSGVACYQDTAEEQLIINYLTVLPGDELQSERQIVDDAPGAGAKCSMIVAEGVPMIVYEEWNNYTIQFAVLR